MRSVIFAKKTERWKFKVLRKPIKETIVKRQLVMHWYLFCAHSHKQVYTAFECVFRYSWISVFSRLARLTLCNYPVDLITDKSTVRRTRHEDWIFISSPCNYIIVLDDCFMRSWNIKNSNVPSNSKLRRSVFEYFLFFYLPWNYLIIFFILKDPNI